MAMKAKKATGPTSNNRYGHIIAEGGYRSKFEAELASILVTAKCPFGYEKMVVPYHRPANYHPDFAIYSSCIVIEAKGFFEPEDRTKMLLVKARHPELDIRFVFQTPNSKLNKNSKTTYGMWADKHGFPWAAKCIPLGWLNEKPTEEKRRAFEALLCPA